MSHRKRDQRSTAALPRRVGRAAARAAGCRCRRPGAARRGRSRRRRPAPSSPCAAQCLRHAARSTASISAARACTSSSTGSSARKRRLSSSCAWRSSSRQAAGAPSGRQLRRQAREQRPGVRAGRLLGPLCDLRASPSRRRASVRAPSAPSVSTSTPASVTSTVCSHCADSEWSLVMTVQPSGSSRTWRLPAFTIGSMVKVMPGLSSSPVPGSP